MKKIIATVLAMVMALALCTTAFAAETTTTVKKDGYSVAAIDNSTITAVAADFTKTTKDNKVVTDSTGTPALPCARTRQAPAAVAVHWAVWVRLAPYSSGVRNCRSAAQKWLLVSARTRSAMPPAANTAARPSVSAMVEHAP